MTGRARGGLLDEEAAGPSLLSTRSSTVAEGLLEIARKGESLLAEKPNTKGKPLLRGAFKRTKKETRRKYYE